MKKLLSALSIAVAAAAVAWSPMALGQQRPDTRPATRPDTRPGTRPDTRPDVRPGTRPDTRPDVRPGTERPDVRRDERHEKQVYEERWRRWEAERRERDKIRHDEARWERERDARAREHRRYMRTYWGVYVDRPEARWELALHADRMARLNRILDISVQAHDDAQAKRTRTCIDLEVNRNGRVMEEIRARGSL